MIFAQQKGGDSKEHWLRGFPYGAGHLHLLDETDIMGDGGEEGEKATLSPFASVVASTRVDVSFYYHHLPSLFLTFTPFLLLVLVAF